MRDGHNAGPVVDRAATVRNLVIVRANDNCFRRLSGRGGRETISLIRWDSVLYAMDREISRTIRSDSAAIGIDITPF